MRAGLHATGSGPAANASAPPPGGMPSSRRSGLFQQRQDAQERQRTERAASPRRASYSSTAFREIPAFISFEIGQPVFASFAALSNPAASMPGTEAEHSR